MKLLDANKKLINTTLSDNTYEIKSAVVGANGIATSDVVTNLNIDLTSAQVNDIKTAKYFIYNVVLSGQDPLSELQFTSKDILSVKLGVFVKVNKTTNL